MTIGVQLQSVGNVAAEPADGYVVYPHAHVSGGTVLHRVLANGVEDFVSFDSPPKVPKLSYDLTLEKGVGGLRLVAGTLEVLDASGAPRLRAAPPFIVGADGVRRDATLALEGCAVDTNPAAPWGRPVTPPGASLCQIDVTWPSTGVVYPAVLDPQWTTTQSMMTPRQGHTATLLLTGNVLAVGGTSDGSTALATAELYNRTSGTWAVTSSMMGARTLHSATQLNTSSNGTTSGAVLVVGGLNGSTSQSTALLYSPSAGTWTAATNLSAGRHGHTGTLLADGRVLVTGGLNGTTVLNTAALYDPTGGTGTWTATAGLLPSALKNHTAVLLTTSNAQLSNKVLVFGGNNGSTTVSGVYLFDPTQSTFGPLEFLPTACEGQTVTVLGNGNVLVTGGTNGATAIATTVLFNPSSGLGTWSSAGTMTVARQAHTATLIPSSGQVLVAGGSSGSATLSSAELWNGTSWTTTTALLSPQQAHTATLLGNDTVLIAGGVNGATTVSTAQLYSASSGLECTGDNQCVTGFCVGGVCCDTACTNQCMACNMPGQVGTCSPKTNGTACNDGNACTQTDTCQAGTCTGSNPVICRAQDQCHVVGTCNTSTGVCSNPAATNGTACNDGNACTRTDTCQTGVCTGSNPVTCTAQDQCHVAGTCNASTGVCSNPAVANGTACNDGNACTQTDTCQTGICTGSNPVTCMAQDQCHVAGTCNTSTGTCSNPAAANGTACNDGNACTQTDTCQTGVCTGANPVTCTALDQCHLAGTCTPATGCSNPAKPNNTPCDDGNQCTQGDACQSGSCQTSTFPTVVNILVNNLGNLGGTFSTASGINSSGQLVGQAATPSGQLDSVFCPSGQTGSPMVDLGVPGPPSTASAINDTGFIAGSFTEADGSHLYRWGSETGVVDFGLVGDGSTVTDEFQLQGAYGYGIDASGQLTGIYTDGGQLHGFRYTDGVGFEDVGSLGGIATYAYGIDPNTGTVVGGSRLDFSPTDGYERQGHAFMFDDSVTGIFDLNRYVDPLSGLVLINASAISGDYIVGGASRAGVVRAFRLNLAKLQAEEIPSGWEGPTFALATNSHGDTVGWGYLDAAQTDQAAFIYSDRLGFKNLNDVIADDGWYLSTATSINDSGEIVGQGYLEGNPTAFHLNLTPESVACNQLPGVCGQGGSVCVWADGVADLGDGKFMAVFGYNSSSSSAVTPTQNEERVNGVLVTNPQPAPPSSLQPGIHTAAFVPTFTAGQAVTWTVNGQTATANADSPILPTVPLPNGGTGVDIGGSVVSVSTSTTDAQPSALTPIAEGIVNDGNTTYGVFSYTNSGSTNIAVPYGPQNQLTIAAGIVLTNPTPRPPVWFLPGTHRGILVYPISSTNLPSSAPLSWTLGSQTVSLSTSTAQIPLTTQSAGTGVMIAGQFVILFPNRNVAFTGTILPTEPTYWGSPMPAYFSVGADGSANVNVPIWVPPGRAGLQPDLALSYNSNSTTKFDGLGPGWHVQGLSQITRCAQNLARDGVVADVSFGPPSAFCLDGDELILQTAGALGPGTDGSVYRKEHDTFAKIVLHADSSNGFAPPDSFQVFLKDGRIMTYGNGDGDSTLEAPQTFEPYPYVGALGVTTTRANISLRYAWALKSVVDRSGNTIDYSYTTTVNNDRGTLSTGDEPCVEQHINTISYGSQQVAFNYTPAGSTSTTQQRLPHRMFIGGFCAENTQVMTSIDISGPRPDTSSTKFLKHYILAVQSEGLTAVIEEDSNGVSTSKSVQFTYEDTSPIPTVPTFTALPVTITAPMPLSAPTFPGPNFATGDINGDGFDDLVYESSGTIYVQLSNGGASGQPAFSAPIPGPNVRFDPIALQVIDVDMDGKADIVYTHGLSVGMGEVGPTLENDVYLNQGIDPFGATFVTTKAWTDEYGDSSSSGIVPLVGDLDGDGLPDLAINDPTSGHWIAYNNTATPFSGVEPSLTSTLLTPSALDSFVKGPISVAGRFLNRQQMSFLNATDSSSQYLGVVAEDMTGQLVDFSDGITNEVPYTTMYVSLDLNGDGLSDLVSVDPRFGQPSIKDPTRTTPTSFINTGDGFRSRNLAYLTSTVPDQALISNTTPVAGVDLNGDGLDDLLILAKDPRGVNSGNGAVPGWFYPSDGNALTNPHPISSIAGSDQPFAVLDFNGDGRPDILTYGTTIDINTGAETQAMKVYQNQQPRQRLVGISGGLNDTPNVITYDSIGHAEATNPNGQACIASYPKYCPPIGPMVVTQAYFQNRDVNDPGIVQTYSYSGALMDIRGRGALGVQNRKVVRTPANDPTNTLTLVDTQYDLTVSDAFVNNASTLVYDYPTAQRPSGEIIYYVNPDNTALASSVGTLYTNIGILPGNVAYLPGQIITQKRTISNFDQVLPTMAPAFNPNLLPSDAVNADIISSTETFYYDSLGNPYSTISTTTLSDKSEVTRTVGTQFQENQDAWLISQPTSRTVIEATTGTSPARKATRSWIFTPDSSTGLLMHETYQPGIPDEQLDTSYVRNPRGQPTTITQAIATGETRSQSIVYDDFDGTFPKQITNALGQTTTLAYHPGFGVLVYSSDPNGLVGSFEYDGFGRFRSATAPDGAGMQVDYQDPELPTGDPRLGSTQAYEMHVSATSGFERKMVSDVLNRESFDSSKDFTGTVYNGVSTTFDQNNIRLPSQVTIPSVNPTAPGTPAFQLTYDSMGRHLSTTLPDGSEYSYSYAADTSWSMSGPAGISGSGKDDGRGSPMLQSNFVMKPGDTTGHVIGQTYKYGPFGVLAEIDVQNGPTTTIMYDDSGRRIELDDPDTGHSTFKWNGFGDLTEEADATGEVKTYSPDALGRIQQVTTADGVTTYEWDSAPNGIGKLAKTTSPDNVECAYGYDSGGRVTTETWTVRSGIVGIDGVYSLGVGYDSRGRPSSLTYPAIGDEPPLVIDEVYAPNGQVAGAVRDATGQALWTVNSRNERGQITSETAGNGVTTTYTYPPATDLLQEVTSTAGGQTLRDLQYQYDAAHRLAQRTTDGQIVEIFQHDTIDRLVTWQVGQASGSSNTTYTYDDLGNLTSVQQSNGSATSTTSFTPGDGVQQPPHQIASSSLGTYGYNARGDQYASPGREVAYTSFGLPKSITTASGITSFAYDASQARVLKVRGDTVTLSLGGMFERRIASGQIEDFFYVAGDGGATPVAQILWQEAGTSVAEVVQYLHSDRLQSIETVTDSTGAVVARERFDPFGTRLSAPQGVLLGFQGAEEDDDLGLINMNGRVYDPQQFRFITADPTIPNPLFGQDLNRYAFVRNSPLSYRDPSGFGPEDGDPEDPPPQPPQQEDPEEPGSAPPQAAPPIAYPHYEGYGSPGGPDGPSGPPVDDTGPGAAPGIADGNGSGPPGIGLGGIPLSPGPNGSSFLPYGAPGPDPGSQPFPTGTLGPLADNSSYCAEHPGSCGGRDAFSGKPNSVTIPIVILDGPTFLQLWRSIRAFLGIPEAAGPAAILAQKLVEAANSGSPFTQVWTRLTQTPAIGRALSVASGPGAEALTDAAREGGSVYMAQIPTRLIMQLEANGMATTSLTQMGDSVATEIRFSAAASQYIAPFFQNGKIE